MPASFPPTLVVLAGGEARRMGTPKAQLRINGNPILSHLLDQWQWPGSTLLVTAPGRENPDAHNRFDCQASDPIAGAGPLRGLLTALQNIATPLAIVTAVDMPRLGREQFDWLLDSLQSNPGKLGLMCKRIDRGEEIIEPFPLAIHRDALDIVESSLQNNRRSMHSLLNDPAFIAIAPPPWPATVWTNLNAPADFDRFCSEFNPSKITGQS